MKTVFVVYTCDAWHSYSSKTLLGITSSRKNAYKLVKNKGYKLSNDDFDDLETINQTQGRETNIMVDPFIINEGI